MKRLSPLISLFCLPLLLVGCVQEQPVGLSDQARPPRFDVANGDACPTPADHVVSDEAGLVAAVAAAGPGDVIGVAGLIDLTQGLFLPTDGLTLTCATPGSGLSGAGPGDHLVFVGGPNITVDRLILDGSAAGRTYGAGGGAVGARLSNNSVTCSDGICAFFFNGGNAEVINNTFLATSPNIQSGLHMQNLGGSNLIEDNTITTTNPAIVFPAPVWGGIRLLNVSNATVVDNKILGPWWNGMALRIQDGMVVQDNVIKGVGFNGLRLRQVVNSTFHDNKVKGSGEVGILALDNPPGSTSNNTFDDNAVVGSGIESCRDDTQGSGTAGTASQWIDNKGEAPSSPPGLCPIK